MYDSCYLCEKIILESDPGGMENTHGKRMKPTRDYTNIDVHLKNDKQTYAFATPVCVDCCAKLIKEKLPSDLEAVKKKLLSNVKRENFIKRDFIESNVSVVNVVDLTETLRENRII